MTTIIKAIIFDIDGTLVDSVDRHAEAWVKAFQEHGHDLPFEKVREQIGKDSDFLVSDLLPAKEAEKLQSDLTDYHDEYYQNNLLEKVKPFPKVKELFEAIKADDLKIVLATSAKKEMLEHYKKLLDIENLVDGATSTDDVDQSKPEPEIFKAALDKLSGISPEEVIVVGDSPYDAISAGKVPIRTIGVLCGGFERDILSEAGCLAIYHDPADLLDNYPKFLNIDEIG